MFKEILRFDLKTALKSPMVYVFVFINFALVFAASVSDNVQIGGANDAIHINAPHVIMKTTLLLTLIGIFMTTAFMNRSMLKDYDYKFDGLMFSTSITKLGYLGGRFLSSFLLSLLPFVGVLTAIAVAGMVNLVDPGDVGAIYPSHYLSVFLCGVVPNIFIICSIIFVFISIFKSNMYSFIGAIGLLILYLLMGTVTGDLDNEMIAILSDPLGISTYDILTKYWTISEKNTQMISFSGLWLINRVIWISISSIMLLLTFRGFSFAQKKAKLKKKKDETADAHIERFPILNNFKALPEVATSDSLGAHWSLFLHQSWYELRGILRSTPFIVITLFSMVNMVGLISSIDESYGTGNHPVTYLMVDAIRGSLYLFLISVIMYYAGGLIWKERDHQMNEMIDTSPYPSWVPYLSKMAALIGITIFTLMIGICLGVIAQSLAGYTNYEFGVYIRELLVYDMVRFIGLIALAMFIQTLVNNKYLGYFTFLIAIVALKFGPQALEISSNMVAFGNLPSYTYSDMNGWSLYATGLTWFSTYWTLFAALLTAMGTTLWVRGLQNDWSTRIQLAVTRLSGRFTIVMAVLGILWIGTSSFLFYQTQIINPSKSPNQLTIDQVEYERKYKQYEHIAQPRIIAVDYNIDIFPYDHSFRSDAEVSIKNKTDEVIKEIHFTLQDAYKVEIQISDATLKLEDVDLKYQIFELNQALQPGEERKINIKSSYGVQGIENEVSSADIVENGTFLRNFKFMPVIGYASSRELSDDGERKEHDLPRKVKKAKLHSGCSAACQNSYISQDADWVKVTSTISTENDQIAIAPGSLKKTWEQDGRKFFKYELEEKVLNFYSFISGRYEVARDQWMSAEGQVVDVEVYYHKGHEYNVDKMISSLKNSLSYLTENFTDYPHRQARIIEFPRYDDFAQAFPGTMPYSESMGFIANLNEEHAIDMVYYVVAHEMAHQWWAHQVIGADIQGSNMLSETFAQYSALMIMKKQYGADKMKQFLRYEMDRYLRGRAREDDKETPLLTTEDHPYVYYRKGSVVMYALQDYIGEEKINRALRTFAEAKSYQEPPYTNSLDFMDYLRAEVPDSLTYLISDMIESITLYNNTTSHASYRALGNGEFEVSIDVKVEKYVADSLGTETLVPHNDLIDIGIFSEDIPEGERYGRPILIERVRISERKQSFTFVVSEEPHSAGIDPNYLLVDRMPKDNVKVLELEN